MTATSIWRRARSVRPTSGSQPRRSPFAKSRGTSKRGPGRAAPAPARGGPGILACGARPRGDPAPAAAGPLRRPPLRRRSSGRTRSRAHRQQSGCHEKEDAGIDPRRADRHGGGSRDGPRARARRDVSEEAPRLVAAIHVGHPAPRHRRGEEPKTATQTTKTSPESDAPDARSRAKKKTTRLAAPRRGMAARSPRRGIREAAQPKAGTRTSAVARVPVKSHGSRGGRRGRSSRRAAAAAWSRRRRG